MERADNFARCPLATLSAVHFWRNFFESALDKAPFFHLLLGGSLANSCM